MKKMLSVIAVCALSLSVLAGCGQKTFKLSKVNTSKYVSTLGQYKGLTVEAEPKTELDEASYEYFYRYMFPQFSQGSAPEGYEAQLGDTLILDYSGSVDGEVFEGGTAQGQSLELGSGTFIPGFESSLVGVKAGEVRDIDVTFPDPYQRNADLSGAAAVFKCTIHQIIPGYSEENVAKLSNPNFKNIEEYKAFVRKNINDMIDDEYREVVVAGALSQIEASTVVKSVPEELLEEQKKAVIKSYEVMATQYGVSVEDLLKQYGTSVDEQAEKFAKRTLICQAIANIENISVSDDEVKTKGQEFVDEAEGFNTIEEFFEEYGYEYYKNYLMSQKVYDFILEACNVVAPGEGGSTQVLPSADAEEGNTAEETEKE
ncbi:MAG: trigger factor [Lachnospiraceae bacterium]|nr:trigger factor [Lachnospiraceae bacterium]